MNRPAPPWERPPARPALYAWAPSEGEDRLRTIEDDVARLTLDLAVARRALSEQQDAARDDRLHLFLDLLEVTDGFERVFAAMARREDEVSGPARAWVRSFRTVYRLLERTLAAQGVTPIEITTPEFDPAWHTAAETVTDASLPVGTIVEEIARGYVWQRHVLRKSAVVVVRADDDGAGPAHTTQRDAD